MNVRKSPTSLYCCVCNVKIWQLYLKRAWMVGSNMRWRLRKCKSLTKGAHQQFDMTKGRYMKPFELAIQILPCWHVKACEWDMWAMQRHFLLHLHSYIQTKFGAKELRVWFYWSKKLAVQKHKTGEWIWDPRFLWVFIFTKLSIDFAVQASSFTLSFCGMRFILDLKSLILVRPRGMAWQWRNKLFRGDRPNKDPIGALKT